MTPEKRAELRKLAEAATPGPWTSSRFNVVDLASPRRIGDPYLVIHGDHPYGNHDSDSA